jgi:hypothetical protein
MENTIHEKWSFDSVDHEEFIVLSKNHNILRVLSLLMLKKGSLYA